MRRQNCNAVACRAAVLDTEVLCAKHLGMVQSDTKRILGRTFRPNKQYQSAVFRETLERARQEILYCQTEGHMLPRDRPFQWDDDPEIP